MISTSRCTISSGSREITVWSSAKAGRDVVADPTLA